MEEPGLLESKETAPQVSVLCLPVTRSCFETMAADGSAGEAVEVPSSHEAVERHGWEGRRSSCTVAQQL